MKKKLVALVIGTFALSAIFTSELSAQVSLSAEDSTECVAQNSIMSEYMKQKNYELAIPAWRILWSKCADRYQGVFVYGNTLYKDLIKKTADTTLKEKYVDTLMLIHDKRIELSVVNAKKFGDKSANVGRKIVDYVSYRKDEIEPIYAMTKAAFDEFGEFSDPNVIIQYMLYAEKKRIGKTLECSDIIDLYSKFSEVTDKRFAATNDSSWIKVQLNVDKLSERCLDCEALIDAYGRAFEGNKTNAAWLSKAAATLDKKQCAKKAEFKANPVIGDIFKAYAESAQTADAFAKYAVYLISNEKATEAITYIEKAVELEADNNKKASYYYTLAQIQFADKKYSVARDNARKAASLRPNWGDPYVLIGDMYYNSASSCAGDNVCLRGAGFAAAADKYTYAASIDPKVAEEANRKAGNCRANYLPYTELFMACPDYKEGQSVTVGCWINETTTFRTKKD